MGRPVRNYNARAARCSLKAQAAVSELKEKFGARRHVILWPCSPLDVVCSADPGQSLRVVVMDIPDCREAERNQMDHQPGT